MTAAWLFCAPVASASGTWLRSSVLSRPGDVTAYPDVAIDTRGRALVVWSEILGNFNYVVRSSRQLHPRARWAPGVNLSSPAVSSLGLQLAEDPRGAASVVWDQDFESTDPHPQPAFIGSSFLRTPTSVWSSPRRVSPFSGLSTAGTAGVGVDARGNAVTVWAQELAANTIYAAASPAGSGRWSAPLTLDGPGPLEAPVVAVSPNGSAVAAWLRTVSGGVLTAEYSVVMAAVRSAQGVWGRPVSLGSEYEPPLEGSANTHAPGPRVAINKAGEAIVVWQHLAGNTIQPEADALNPKTMRWGSPQPIARSYAIDPNVALDAAGDATVAWSAPVNRVMTSSRRLAGRCSWTPPRTLLKTQLNIPFPQVAVNPSGATVIVWEGPVRAAVRPSPGGAWQRTATLSPAEGGVPQVALDAQGDAAVTWEQPARKFEVVRAARYIASGRPASTKPLPCR